MTKVSGKGKKARSFSGCKCCKQAKRKCPEERPQCSICEKLGLKCEYDLNFLFRCETVSFDGHISKAARITRPAPLDSGKRHVTNIHAIPTSPRKIIKYEFIDESASIMSPTLTQERSPSPVSRSAGSPDSAFTLLLEAVNSKTASVGPSQVLTPPQSPDASLFKEMPQRISRGSLDYILN